MRKLILLGLIVAALALWWLVAPKTHAQDAAPVPYHKFCVGEHGKEVRCPKGRLICTDPQKKEIDCKVFDERMKGAIQSDPVTSSFGGMTIGRSLTGGRSSSGVWQGDGQVATTALKVADFESATCLRLMSDGTIKAVDASECQTKPKITCSDTSLIIAIEAAREFVPKAENSHTLSFSGSITAVPAIACGGPKGYGGPIYDDLMGWHCPSSAESPEWLREKAKRLEEKQAKEKKEADRRSAAVETFNQVYKECVNVK